MSKTQIPPCPYCADPNLLDAPTGRGGLEMSVMVTDARFWRSGRPPRLLTAKLYGARFVADVPAKSIAEKFAGFAVRLIGVRIEFVKQMPPMFNSLSMSSVDSTPGGITMFSAWLIEGRSVETRAHWWPSHETLINQRLALSAKDPAGRNTEIEAASLALSFFEMETRGEPKVTESDLMKAIQKLGSEATQVSVASELGVTARAVQRWTARNGLQSWNEVKERYSDIGE